MFDVDFAAISPKDIDEAILIHKLLTIRDNARHVTNAVDHLFDTLMIFSEVIDSSLPNERGYIKRLCKELTDKLSEVTKEFLNTKLKDEDSLMKYTILISSLGVLIHAINMVYSMKLIAAIDTKLMELGAINVNDLKKMKDKED